MNDNADNDPRLYAIPDTHGHAKGEHKAFTDERPIPLSARMLFLWFYHACRRGWPRFLMVTDHMNYLTFEDPAAINLVRRALKLAQAGDLYGAAETASVEVGHAAVVSEGLRRGMRYSLGAEVDNDPRCRPDAQNIVDAMKPDGMIRSVHFLTIDHPTYGPNWNWPFDNPEFSAVFDTIGTAKTWELYMATLLDAVERLPGNIVGHFYVPALFGHWPDDATLESYEDQIVDACEARGMAIELNTRFLYRNHSDEERARYLTAHRRLLAKCKAKNVGVAVGSDAHSPKDQGRAFPAVLALLDECEINELVFPIAGRLARVALRVDRKSDAPPATDSAAGSAPVEDRKTVRKARTSEVPARSKDSSSKRDDVPASDASTDDAPPKAKPRPKRSKSRSAPAGDDAVDTPAGEKAEPHLSPIDTSEADSAAHVESAANLFADRTDGEADFGVVERASVERADRAEGESSFARTLEESGETGATDSELTDVSAAHLPALTLAVEDELRSTKSDGGSASNGAAVAADRSTIERALDEELASSRESGSYGFDGTVVAESRVAQGNASLATAAPAQVSAEQAGGSVTPAMSPPDSSEIDGSADGMPLRRRGTEESPAVFAARDRDDDAVGGGSWPNVSGISSGDARQSAASDTAILPDASEAHHLPNGKSETVLDPAAGDVATLDRADLEAAVLDEAALDEVILDEADLDEVDLDAAAVLDEADLDGAVLDAVAVADEADLDDVVLDATAVDDEADLDGAVLDAVAVVDEADLDDVVLDATAVDDEADLDGAILDAVAVVDEADLDDAVLDAAAVDEADLDAAPDETPLHEQMTSNAAFRAADVSNNDGMSEDAAGEIPPTVGASDEPAEREDGPGGASSTGESDDTLLVLEEEPGETIIEVLKPDTVSSVAARARIITGGAKARVRTASGKTKAAAKANGLKKVAAKPAAKTAPKRAAAPKTAAKKTLAKSGAIKAAPAKKTAAKKTAAKKAPIRPTAAKKTATKKAASKKTAAKKSSAKKPSQKRR